MTEESESSEWSESDSLGSMEEDKEDEEDRLMKRGSTADLFPSKSGQQVKSTHPRMRRVPT